MAAATLRVACGGRGRVLNGLLSRVNLAKSITSFGLHEAFLELESVDHALIVPIRKSPVQTESKGVMRLQQSWGLVRPLHTITARFLQLDRSPLFWAFAGLDQSPATQQVCFRGHVSSVLRTIRVDQAGSPDGFRPALG
jgi:hypothetical protein